MQNETKTIETKSALIASTLPTATKPKPAAKPKAKPSLKAESKAKPTAKPKTKAAKAPAVNAHIAAGINTAAYAGLSGFTNRNRKPQIAADVTRNASQLTTRMQQAFYALRTCYNKNTFAPRGFDNRILADLRAAGLITHKAGTGQTADINGTAYLIDAAKPLAFVISAAGLKYGKA